jgi:hypothetical protein
VRKLWTTELLCGNQGKSRRNFVESLKRVPHPRRSRSWETTEGGDFREPKKKSPALSQNARRGLGTLTHN